MLNKPGARTSSHTRSKEPVSCGHDAMHARMIERLSPLISENQRYRLEKQQLLQDNEVSTILQSNL